MASHGLLQLALQESADENIELMLHKELCGLMNTLVAIDNDNTQSMDNLSDHTEKISNVLQKISSQKLDARQFSFNPIHTLLSVGPLSSIELPLDVLRMLISAGCDVNGYNHCSLFGQTCLPVAIACHHYSAVRVLVEQGAICRERDSVVFGDYFKELNPLTLLAHHQNAPLDLFDLLAERWDLNQEDSSYYDGSMPLHLAAWHGCTENALRLIKLGARVDIVDKCSRLPIFHFVKNYTSEFSHELFIALLPSKTQGINIIRTIYTLLGKTKLESKLTNKVLLEMLHQLLQRLTFVQPLKVVCKETSNISMTINDMDIGLQLDRDGIDAWIAKLIGRMLLAIKFDVVVEYTLQWNSSLEDVCLQLSSQDRVKSLLRLCILQIRTSMSSLDDDSFLSLPVPPFIRRLLAYRDVSEEIFEKWCQQSLS